MVEEQLLSQPFKFFFNNAAIGMVLADPDGEILIANPAFAKRVSNHPQEISRRNFLGFRLTGKNRGRQALMHLVSAYEFPTARDSDNG